MKLCTFLGFAPCAFSLLVCVWVAEVRLFGLTAALRVRTVTPIINMWALFSTAANACILSYAIGSLSSYVVALGPL
jgi:hypothetical protein